jgi:membrane protein DedA with SNARE-associated domain
MNLDLLIEQYGYVAVLVGTFLEGETIVVIAGFLAHQNYLQLDGVIAAAFAGGMLGDQLYFYIGRMKGREFIASRPRLSRHSEKAERLLSKHQIWLILGFRFIYGIRTVTPFILGASKVNAAVFLFLNAISALIWAIAIGFAGFYFGTALEATLGTAERYELAVIGALATGALALWIARMLLHRRRTTRDKKGI